MTDSYDVAGRISGITGQLPGASSYTYAGSISYAPHGAVDQMTLRSGVAENTTFNPRTQPTQIQAGGLLTIAYSYGASGNNGNVLTQTIIRGSQSWAQNYGYDGVNRLTCADEVTGTSPLTCGNAGYGWLETYALDLPGNRAVTAHNGFVGALTNETPQSTAWYGPPPALSLMVMTEREGRYQ